MGTWGDDRDHCPGCGVGLGRDDPCPIPACPCYGLAGFDAVYAADRAHPAARQVARMVASGSAKAGDVLGSQDDLLAGRALRRYEPGPAERRATSGAMDGNAAVEYMNHLDELERRQRDAELTDSYEQMCLRHVARPS
jgi:hypothetical protein